MPESMYKKSRKDMDKKEMDKKRKPKMDKMKKKPATKKEQKKDESKKMGLTAAQKKLPKKLQEAILKKQKKK